MKFLRKKEFKKIILDSKIYENCSYFPKTNKNNKNIKSRIFEIKKKHIKKKEIKLIMDESEKKLKISKFLERREKNLIKKREKKKIYEDFKNEKIKEELNFFKNKKNKFKNQKIFKSTNFEDKNQFYKFIGNYKDKYKNFFISEKNNLRNKKEIIELEKIEKKSLLLKEEVKNNKILYPKFFSNEKIFINNEKNYINEKKEKKKFNQEKNKFFKIEKDKIFSENEIKSQIEDTDNSSNENNSFYYNNKEYSDIHLEDQNFNKNKIIFDDIQINFITKKKEVEDKNYLVELDESISLNFIF